MLAGLRMALLGRLKLTVKLALAGLLFRYYPITLAPLAVNCWVNEVIKATDVEGDCVEIGVNLGGTSVFTKLVMNDLGIRKKYFCYDTFGGFIPEQVQADIAKGLDRRVLGSFGANSIGLVKRIFAIHGVGDIVAIKGDIETQETFPAAICACLVDVDLSEPTYTALKKIYPRLSPQGFIMVDDCHDEAEMKAGSWRANEGVTRFVTEMHLAVEYKYGLAIIRKPAQERWSPPAAGRSALGRP